MCHNTENTTMNTAASVSSTSEEYPATRTAVAILVSTALFILAQLYASIPLLTPVSSAFRADATLPCRCVSVLPTLWDFLSGDRFRIVTDEKGL